MEGHAWDLFTDEWTQPQEFATGGQSTNGENAVADVEFSGIPWTRHFANWSLDIMKGFHLEHIIWLRFLKTTLSSQNSGET